MATKISFSQLSIGDRFEFLTPSFTSVCTKISARMYRWDGASGVSRKSEVGTIHVLVRRLDA